MYKYLAISRDVSGIVISSRFLTDGYVFKAENDEEALEIILSVLEEERDRRLAMLCRITGGLQVQQVSLSRNTTSTIVPKKLTADQKRKSVSNIYLLKNR